VKDLVCSQRGTKYRSGTVCERSGCGELSPHWIVGTLLLLLPLMLLLLLGEAINSLPTKNFVELRLNDVGTTTGERGLIPGKV